jgi:hypothetical protein
MSNKPIERKDLQHEIGNRSNGKEELSLFGRAPSFAIRTQGSAGDNAVKMGMEVELLSPGM